MQNIYVQLTNAIIPSRNPNDWLKVSSAYQHRIGSTTDSYCEKDKAVLDRVIRLAIEAEYGVESDTPFPRNAFVTLSEPESIQTKPFSMWIFSIG